MEAIHEPSGAEVFLTLTIGRLAGSVYGDYVKGLGLKGNERLLDFGSGSGNPALHLATILEKGGGELVCMDVSRKWLDVSRKRLQGHKNVARCAKPHSRSRHPENPLLQRVVLYSVPVALSPTGTST